MARRPTLRLERALLAEGRSVVVGIDEVGRGALAGPLVVAAVAVSDSCRSAPKGVRDSKLVTPSTRERLAPAIQRWAAAVGVGQCAAAEVDAFGMTTALRTAALRALAALPYATVPMVLLDGAHQFLPAGVHVVDGQPVEVAESRCAPRADNTWASVAAASIVAKVTRDRLMVQLADRFTGYQWESNKGYATAEHMAALVENGPCPQHRLTWRLPLADDAGFAMMGVPASQSASAAQGGRGEH